MVRTCSLSNNPIIIIKVVIVVVVVIDYLSGSTPVQLSNQIKNANHPDLFCRPDKIRLSMMIF